MAFQINGVDIKVSDSEKLDGIGSTGFVQTNSAQALHATDALRVNGSNIELHKANGTSESVAVPVPTLVFEPVQVELTASQTVTVPAGATGAYVIVIGGGGGSGGATSSSAGSDGGGGGGVAIGFVDVTAGQQIVCTVGAGGTAGSTTTAGGAGGTSSFGTLLTATGGAGGLNNRTITVTSTTRNCGAGATAGGVGTGGTDNRTGITGGYGGRTAFGDSSGKYFYNRGVAGAGGRADINGYLIEGHDASNITRFRQLLSYDFGDIATSSCTPHTYDWSYSLSTGQNGVAATTVGGGAAGCGTGGQSNDRSGAVGYRGAIGILWV